MSGGAKVPQPSAEERALQAEQANLLRLQQEMIEEQRAQNRILLPFLAEQEGFDVQVDENGNITGISRRPDPIEDQNKEIARLMNERSLAALRGELPVDPALERSLESEEESLRNRLIAQFGPGYETSSPGIETLGEFFSTAEGLREGARTGQLTLAEQLGLTRQQQNIFARQSGQDVLRTSAVGDPLAFAGAFGQVAKGFGQAQIPYIQQRQLQAQVAMSNSNSMNALIGAGIGAVGSMLSDEDIKGDLIQISETSHGIPIYAYTRTDTGEQMIGVLAKDVEEVMPGLVYDRGGYKTVQYRELQ